MIKLATSADLPIVSSLITEFMQNYKLKNMFSNMDQIIPIYLDPNSNSERVCILSEDNTGVAAFEYIPMFKLARVALVYIKPEVRGQGLMEEFLDAFEFWGKKVGSKFYRLDVSTGADLTKRGYEQCEIMFMKEVK